MNKAANYFSDFYLLEEAKKVIVGALKSAIGEGEPDTAAEYNLDESSIPKLVDYLIVYSNDEHKVLIDLDIQLIKNAHELMHPDSLGSEEPWTSLHESIETVYAGHEIDLRQMISRGFKNNEMLSGKLDTNHSWMNCRTWLDNPSSIHARAKARHTD